MRRILTLVTVLMWCTPAAGQTTAERSAEILRNLKSPVNKTDYHYVIPNFAMPRLGSRSLPRLRRQPTGILVPRATATPRIPRRLDGTPKSEPPIVYGLAPGSLGWYVQWFGGVPVVERRER